MTYSVVYKQIERMNIMFEKEDQRVMLTKRLLKDSLVSLLKEKTIFKITIRELCDTAGINRSTFYKYYDSQYL